MGNINYWALLVAVLVAFIASAIYYILFAKQRAQLSPAAREAGRPRPSMMLTELLRNLILAGVLAYLLRRLDITTVTGAVWLGCLLWLAFPFILLTGSVMYEKLPWKLAAIHAGDWALKLLLLLTILGLWQ